MPAIYANGITLEYKAFEGSRPIPFVNGGDSLALRIRLGRNFTQ